MQNSMVVFTFTVLDQKYYFFGKLGPKNQTFQFKIKFGTWTYSNIQNLRVMFTFHFRPEILFWVNLVQKIKTASLSWNLVPRLFRIFWIQKWNSLFSVFNWKYASSANLVQKIKIVSLSWNLALRLLGTCRI